MLDVPCTTDEMWQFISGGYFSLSNAFFGNDVDTIQGGGTVGQWRQEYEERVKKEVIPADYSMENFRHFRLKPGYIACQNMACRKIP